MFKICNLFFYSGEKKEGYVFKKGLNYFHGLNNSGKTEFYIMLDYMFGSSNDIQDKDCYNNLITKISMDLEYEGKKLTLIRTLNPNENYIAYGDDTDNDILSLELYRKKLDSFFSRNEIAMRNLRDFVGENYTYRIFTMFNFLSEKQQGYTQNFLSKCSETKYWIRQEPILNYLFNKNLTDIKNKENEVLKLENELSKLQKEKNKSEFILNKINSNLMKISPDVQYTGSNADEIKSKIHDLKSMNASQSKLKEKNISDLEVKYNSIYEQIKKYNNEINNIKEMNKDDANKKLLIEELTSLLKKTPELKHLIEPSLSVLNDLTTSISFGNYITKDKTVKRLKDELDKVKIEIEKNNSLFQIYSLSEKEKSIAVIEEYLESGYKYIDLDVITKLQSEIRNLKNDIKKLKNDDSKKEIDDFSYDITSLYLSGVAVSPFILTDSKELGFKIQYIKKGNVLQPVRKKILMQDGMEKELIENYFPGSMARHTVMQLCGYLAYLKKIIASDIFPIIPFLVIDHISKSFDVDNKKAVGLIINNALKDIGEDKLQIFMFDTELADAFDIDPSCSTNLIDGEKTGFCPFYKPKNEGNKNG